MLIEFMRRPAEPKRGKTSNPPPHGSAIPGQADHDSGMIPILASEQTNPVIREIFNRSKIPRVDGQGEGATRGLGADQKAAMEGGKGKGGSGKAAP